MKILVRGKQHLSGTSKKSGNPYSFSIVHFTAPFQYKDSVGEECDHFTIDDSIISFESIKVGCSYEVMSEFKTGRISGMVEVK